MLNRYVVPDMPSADELLPYLRRIDANRWYSNFGPLVAEFENRLTAHLTSLDTIKNAGPISLISVTSCYHALQAGLQSMHLPHAARVLLPSVTFPACPLAVRHAGAEPVLADVDGETWQLTPAIARKIVASTEIHAVMPVAVYGVPVPADEWDAFVEETGIPVIIDAAAALEAQSIPRRCLVAHSLHATKPFSIGEGGVLISRNRAFIEEARRITNFGTQMRITVQDGSNSKMSEYQAAVALAQFDRWEGLKKKRTSLFSRMRASLTGSGLAFQFQKNAERAIASTMMLKTAYSATVIADALNADGLFGHRMYLPPLYHHPHFAGLTIANGDGRLSKGDETPGQKDAMMPSAAMMQQSLFGIPFHLFLEERDIAHLISRLKLAVEKAAPHPARSMQAR
jgi:dTDP-4-amino-4,6-dideoxygalactose transaminase